MTKRNAPNCYDCEHRGKVFYSTHSTCSNPLAKVSGNVHGISHGWFAWPVNFDPVWLDSCDGFKAATAPAPSADEEK